MVRNPNEVESAKFHLSHHRFDYHEFPDRMLVAKKDFQMNLKRYSKFRTPNDHNMYMNMYMILR